MGVQCIAIGNRIMGDDSIGIKVLEEIRPELEEKYVEVIFAETDIDYGLSKIRDGDLLFIIDASYFNIAPGTVSFTPIEDAMKRQPPIYSGHQPSLIRLLKTYKKAVDGFIIGIEVEKVYFSMDISETLQEQFHRICVETLGFIYQIIRGS